MLAISIVEVLCAGRDCGFVACWLRNSACPFACVCTPLLTSPTPQASGRVEPCNWWVPGVPRQPSCSLQGGATGLLEPSESDVRQLCEAVDFDPDREEAASMKLEAQRASFQVVWLTEFCRGERQLCALQATSKQQASVLLVLL